VIRVKPLGNPSPSMVKQYIYCPVIPWINSVYGIYEPVTDSMRIGREKSVEKGVGQVRVSSNGSTTVIDELVREGGEYILVEYKTFKSKSIHRHLAQALAAYIIASRKIPGVKKIRLSMEGKTITITPSQQQIEEIAQIIERTKQATTSDKPPPPTTNRSKCQKCWYRKICPYT